jgi:hypothetical protein
MLATKVTVNGAADAANRNIALNEAVYEDLPDFRAYGRTWEDVDWVNIRAKEMTGSRKPAIAAPSR